MKSQFHLISLLVSLFIKFIYATDENTINSQNNKEQHYLIHLNNEYGEYKIYSNDNLQKREASYIYVESMKDKINGLIMKNIDTYENPNKLKEMRQSAQSGKETTMDSQSIHFNDFSPDYVYPISSVGNSVILYAYLSEELVHEIQSIHGVNSCIPDTSSFSLFNYYNTNDILKETQWKDFTVQEDAPVQLSLLSQGQYNHQFVNQYDSNYYYPSSAGKDIDIVIFDSRFDFDYSEFNNTDDRIARCAASIEFGTAFETQSKRCGRSPDEHGHIVSDIAAGKEYGAAKNANIYGISINIDSTGYFRDSDFIGGLQYIYEKLLRPHKTIINLSFGGSFPEESIGLIKTVINEITKKGGIVVSAAGNSGILLGRDNEILIPCELDDVICVGGFSNEITNPVEMTYTIHEDSNYGLPVDLYAPFWVEFAILDGVEILYGDADGTSFSSPLVVGIIATIMSENPEVKYTKETILQQLRKNGKNEIISYHIGNGIMANNGKHIVYSKDGKYNGCGTYAGNQVCNANQTPSFNEIPSLVTPVIREDGKCGPNNGYAVCGDGRCCSYFGYCAVDNESCGYFCLSGYGKCDTDKPSEGRCGPGYGSCANPNECCNEKGYCGVTSDYCGEECQSEFGKCNISSTTTTTTTSTTTTTTKKTTTTTTKKTTTTTTTTKKTTTTTKKATTTTTKKTTTTPKKTTTTTKKTTTTPKKTTTTTKKTKTTSKIPTSTVKGKCGPNYGACPKSTDCCSQYGYCGTSSDYCGTGCQSEFGQCDNGSTTTTTATTTTTKKTTTSSKIPTSTVSGKCGPNYGACLKSTDCCSKYGYCGTSSDYCGTGCQSEFGKCGTPSTTTTTTSTKKATTTTKKKTTTTSTKIPISTTIGRCGPEFGSCHSTKYCCSKYGYCGTTVEYCGIGCQPSYGLCK